MYTINVQSNFPGSISYAGKDYASGSSFSTGSIGGFDIITVEGVGPISIIDMGTDTLHGYPSTAGTWAVLFRYQTVEVYARYDAGGEFNFIIDKYGDLEIVPVNGTATVVKLPGMSLGVIEIN